MEDKKINNAAVEIIKLLGELDLTPKESLEAVLKSLHFIIEKGFCQTEAKTAQLVTKVMCQTTLLSATPQN